MKRLRQSLEWFAQNPRCFLVVVMVMLLIYGAYEFGKAQSSVLVSPSDIIAVEAVPGPKWTQRSPAFDAAAYGKTLQAGVQTLSEATLAKSLAYATGKTLGIGWPRSGPWDVCTTADGCCSCVAFDQATICYSASKQDYSLITPFASYGYVGMVTGLVEMQKPPTVTGGKVITSPWPFDASPWPPAPRRQ